MYRGIFINTFFTYNHHYLCYIGNAEEGVGYKISKSYPNTDHKNQVQSEIRKRNPRSKISEKSLDFCYISFKFDCEWHDANSLKLIILNEAIFRIYF